MIYNIFRNGLLVVQIKPSDSSEISQIKQQEDIIRLNFISNSFLDIRIGDCIFYLGELYSINKKPKVIENPKNYQYECIFEGGIHELRKTKVFLTTQKTNGFYKDYKFPLTGNAKTFLQFIVENLNRGTLQYQIGKFKETDTITINFNNWNVFDAITEICNQLKISWYLEKNTLNFDEKNTEKSYVFQVGTLLGFIDLTRIRVESENIETVVYGYGSTENMPPRTSSSGLTYDSNLLTENRLCFEGVDGESRLENNVDLYGRIESVQEFDIKPEYTGTVTSIISTLSFSDSNLDFNINDYLLSGIVPKITFLTGKLIGLTFNISYNGNIVMDTYSDESGQYPNDLIFAEIGDTYKIFDFTAPESYINNAKERLILATQEYLEKQSKGLEQFDANVDKDFIQMNNIVLEIGDLVRIVSEPFQIDGLFEIKSLTKKFTNTSDCSLKFGDVLPKGLIFSIKNSNFTNKQSIYNINRTSVTNNQITNIIGDENTWLIL